MDHLFLLPDLQALYITNYRIHLQLSTTLFS